ncbi:MAG: galactose-1-phosphate uridylyltransferase [Candidatus Omnitrophica bacterium]|nr:galactose-1-phosphate uridylyltransferase [Candidatus Omnitrophota bacterium]
MQQLRRDPILGRWIIVQEEKQISPDDYIEQSVGAKQLGKFCPFCVGNEDKSPPDIFVDKTPDQDNNSLWNLRVIANKFPALRVEGDLDRQGIGIYDQMNGIGAHEVIIETSDHQKDIADLSNEEVSKIIFAYKQRFLDLKQDSRFQYILIFKNHGQSAGASLEHSHSQLIALPIVPKKMKEALRGAEKYYGFKERCVYCDIIDQELESGDRLICENKNFVAFCPFASCTPFEIWILPKKHVSHFYRISEDFICDFSAMLKDVLWRLKKILTDPPFNFIINTAPIQHEQELGFYHWHMQILPKLTRVAGFEWGTGFYINPSPPEQTAKLLREVV